MKTYCLGFRYNEDGVLMIEKTDGGWLNGLVNGLGGTINPEETAVGAMVREFREESGLKTKETDWSLCAVLTGYNWMLHVFSSYGPTDGYVAECAEGRVSMYTCIPSNMEQTADWLLRYILDQPIIGSFVSISLKHVVTGGCSVVFPQNHMRTRG